MDKSTISEYLSSRYVKKAYSDHNYPTPMPIVDFVEKHSTNKNVLAERNVEWTINGKVDSFLSDCPSKRKVVQLLNDELNINTTIIDSRGLNIAKARDSMDITKTKLRTNYPFTSEETGNLRANIWPDLLRRDWSRGYEEITAIISSAWALADTSNTGKTNIEARQFILPKLNWFVWNDLSLFQPHATVQTCTIDLLRTPTPCFDVYDYQFNHLYRGDKSTENYVFKTSLTRDLVNLQKTKFGNNYTANHWPLGRNQFPKSHHSMVDVFSIDKDGLPTKRTTTNQVDAHFGKYRVAIPFTRNATQRRPWFSTIAIVEPHEAVRKDYTYLPVSDRAKCDSFISLFQTEFCCVLFEDTIYSRGFTGPTTRFIGQFPLDRIWTTSEVLKFLNNTDTTLQDRILKRYSEGFNG